MSGQGTTYEYRVRTQDGTVRTGRVEATDSRTVSARLREQGLTPISVEAVATQGLNRELRLGSSRGKRIKPKDVAVVARQLATMINAGLPILRALRVLVGQAENPALATVLKDVAGLIEGGGSLSSAMERHPQVFPPVMRAMVRAGEAGGFLDDALDSVAGSLEADIKLRRTIKGAMTYPVIVLVVAALAVTAMLLFIVPVFADIFAGLDATLPAPTLAMVVLGNAIKVGGLPVVALGGLAAWWWSRHKHDEAVRSRVDPFRLRMPLFGPLVTKAAVARFVRNLATMASCGVPVVQALEIVGATSGNWAVEQAVSRVREHVRGGGSLAEAIADEPIFPPLVQQMVAVGEDSGELDQMLTRVAVFYDEEVQGATEQLTNMLEPVMIVVVGGIVGAMLLALYLPILTVSDQINTTTG